MTQHERDEFLSGRWVARLATNGADGYPHVTPCYYYWDGSSVYISLTDRRVPGRNLIRDGRCAVVIDMDQRPLMGMGRNHARAVTIVGDAEVVYADDGATMRIDAGPLQGEHLVSELQGKIVSRYGLWERDGVIAGSHDQLVRVLENAGSEDRMVKDNTGRIVVKIRPRRIVSWNFEKAPLLPDGPGTGG
jgi:hypothetical protein